LTSLANFPKVKDLNKVWKAYLLCQDLGLDTGSTSAVIAYAMDLRARGLLTASDTGGLDVAYGNADALVELVGRIARREGLGDILANGVKKASESLGADAQRQAVYTKGGLELWLMEIRPFKGTALASAVTDSGSQNRATYGLCEFYYRSMRKQAETVAKIPTKYEHKPKLVAMYENLHILADALGVCSIPFMPVGLDLWREAYNSCTGMGITSQSLVTAAARIRALERLFNVRDGLNREDDTIAERMFQEPLKGGPWKGEAVDREGLEQMKDEYYSLRGWDREGRPTQETLQRLGLQ
jgi:aldehyde:ferredoxin oxidoreductase